MIRVRRPQTPAVLRKDKARWTKRLLTARGKARSNAQARYRHRQIKETLTRMFSGKCCYCESRISHVDYGHIEHFRPKSCFPELTFEWSNLFLACGICNGTGFKGASFPTADQGGPLLDPCHDEPSEHLRFEFDPRTMLASVYGANPRGETTARLLGLNRPELRAYRSQQVLKLQVLQRFAASDQQAATLLAEAVSDNAEYAAFARALLAEP